jgi:hypothetical protein
VPSRDVLGGTAASTNSPIIGPDIPIYEADTKQNLPAVAYNWRHDEYLVVWHNTHNDGNRDIRAQRVSGSGELAGSPFTVHLDRARNSFQPSVAYDSSNDRYLVVWAYDRTRDGTGWDIYGRFIPWNHPVVGIDPFPICTWNTNESNPVVVYNEHPAWSEFLVVWATGTTGAVPAYVSGRRVFADGSGFPHSDGFTIASDPHYTDNYVNPDVAYNLARNEYMVVYSKDQYDIMATRLQANGNVLGGGIVPIATWPDPEQLPTVAACHTADQYFVAWHSIQAGPQYSVYGRFLNGDGSVADVVQIAKTTGYERMPAVAANAEGRQYLVVWEQQYTNGQYGIWGRLLHADKTHGPKFTIRASSGMYDRWDPAVAAGSPSYLVAWEHERSGSQDIHGNIVTPYGVFLPLVLRSF